MVGARCVKHPRNSNFFHCQGCPQLICGIVKRCRNGFAALRGGPARVLFDCIVRGSCNDCEGVLQWFGLTVLREGVAMTSIHNDFNMLGSLGQAETPVWDLGAKQHNMFACSA